MATCFKDHRSQERIEHSVERLIAPGYEDVNDHEELRDDSLRWRLGVTT